MADVSAPLLSSCTPSKKFQQASEWTAPTIRRPETADRWTWIVIVAHAQLRLARPLAEDLRRPWERPRPPGRLTLARVRRGCRCICRTMPTPAGAPRPSRPGPGRPFGSKNTRPAPYFHAGKRVRTDMQEPAGVNRTGQKSSSGNGVADYSGLLSPELRRSGGAVTTRSAHNNHGGRSSRRAVQSESVAAITD